MCGIFGYRVRGEPEVVRIERREPPGALAIAVQALRHRGPDAEGTALLQGPGVSCGLAHTRLAIMDLSPAGNQPMRTPDGRFTLVYNGEVYNFRDLRAELQREGVRFLSDGDTEVVLHALARWGDRALHRFVGMFALGLWDNLTGTLLLARDRLGEKPLYWLSDMRGLAFASEVRTLLATGWAAPRLDPLGLSRYLERGSCQDPTTLLSGVSALLPGRLLVAGPKGVEVRTWWTLPDAEGGAPAGWKSKLPELLEEAVDLRLISDVPLGMFLSGGIDSATILALAARRHRDALQAFTLSFGEPAFDESARARGIASHLGVRYHAAHLSADEALVAIETAFDAQDLPSHDGLNTWFVSRAARSQGLVVALAGTGGDELFAGYPHFRTFRAWRNLGRVAPLLPKPIREALIDGLTPALPTRARKALGLLASGGEPRAVYALIREMFSPVQRRELLGCRVEQRPSCDNDPPPREEWLNGPDIGQVLTGLELEGYLRDTQLRDIDAMSMGHSMEVRGPLLDHRLVELMMRIPGHERLPQLGLNKPLLVAASGLPETLLRGPKHGFVLPWERWLRGPLRSFAGDILDQPSAHESAALDPSATAATWRRFLRGGLGYGRVLSLVALVRWSRHHGLHWNAGAI